MRFWRVASADLPAASDTNKGGLVWDDSAGIMKWSDGSAWVMPSLSTHTHGSAAIGDFNEAAQDAVGAILTDSATIDFTYSDSAPSISAEVKNDSITYARIQNVSAANKLLGRSSAGAGDVEEIDCDLDGWTAYTPAVSASAGAITTSSATGRYWKLGRTVAFQAEVTISANGTGAGVLRVSAPFAAAQNNVFVGREIAITGVLLTATVGAAGTTLNVVTYLNGYPGGNGYIVTISGTYEAAS